MIRGLLVAIFSLLIFKTEAQSKKLKATLSNYLINLPYDKYFPDWIEEIKVNPHTNIDTLLPLDTSSRLILTGRIDSTILSGTDSTKIVIGKNFIRSSKTMNGNLVFENINTIYFLQQIYFFAEGTVEQEWKGFFARTKKDLKKHTIITYPTSSKKKPPFQTIWFKETDSSGPIVIL